MHKTFFRTAFLAVLVGSLPIFGDGTQTRSFTYVSDLVDGILRLMESDTNEPVNIGNPNEFTLLELFMRHPRQVLTRTQIFEAVWGYDLGATSNALGVYIGYLRRKTEQAGEPRLLHTVRGVGYILRES